MSFSAIAGITYRGISKALTMAIINPWAYRFSNEALLDIATTVARKAETYIADSLNELAADIIDIDERARLTDEIRLQALQISDIMIEQRIAAAISRYFLFRINPARLSLSYSKVRDNRQTGSGFIQDTHGNNGITYSYQGTMGMMRPAVSALKMPQLTPAWHYLQLFKRFFLHHNNDLIFVLDDEAIVGRLDTFTFDRNANDPWIIEYRFQATMYPGTEFSLLDGYVGAAFDAIKPTFETPLQSIVDPFKGDKPVSSSINVFEDTYGTLHAQELASL